MDEEWKDPVEEDTEYADKNKELVDLQLALLKKEGVALTWDAIHDVVCLIHYWNCADHIEKFGSAEDRGLVLQWKEFHAKDLISAIKSGKATNHG